MVFTHDFIVFLTSPKMNVTPQHCTDLATVYQFIFYYLRSRLYRVFNSMYYVSSLAARSTLE